MGTIDRATLGAGLRGRYEDEGMTIRELAEELGRSEDYVRRLLRESGTEIESKKHVESWLTRLEREGRITRAKRPKGKVPPPLVPLRDGPSLSDIVIAHRGGA